MGHIAADASKLNHAAPVEMFVLDLSRFGGGVFRFSAHVNELGQPIIWQGNTYTVLPIEASGFTQRSSGPFPRPKLKCSNTRNTLGALLRGYDNLRGVTITRKRTLARYLDAANFARVNWLRGSETLDLSPWTSGAATVTAGALLAPSGMVTAELLQESSATGEHQVQQTAQCTLAAGDLVTASVHVHAGAGEARELDLRFTADGAFAAGGMAARFDPVTGASLSVFDGVSVSTEALDNGWWRVGMTARANAAGAPRLRLRTRQPGVDSASFPGNTGAGLYLWGAQVELGGEMRTYRSVGAAWSGNPDADPLAAFADEVWTVDRTLTRNKQVVEWELANPIDVAGVLLPARVVRALHCPWAYRGEGCGYMGGAVAKADDTPTSLLSEDRCSHKPSGCKKRFGTEPIPGGFFPGAGINREA